MKPRSAAKGSDTALVVNPNSCSGLTGKNWEQLYGRIKKILGPKVNVTFSERTGQGTEIARDLLKKGFSRIVAIGGDGTINEVANGFFRPGMAVDLRQRPRAPRLINPDAVLGLIPCGTRNVLVKSLDLPAGVEESCSNFIRGKPTRMDAIAASTTDPKTEEMQPQRIFLNAAEIGLGAELVYRSKKIRTRVKSRTFSTVAAMLATIPGYKSNDCEIFIDGRRKSLSVTMAVVANGRFIGGGFSAAPDAEVDDGLLDLLVLKDSGSLKVLDELMNVKTGDYAAEDNILYLKAKTVLMRSKERDVTVTLDGEPVGILPASFRILPRVLRVII